VLTPVLNSATHDGQWGLRPISDEELLLCNDIGALQVNLLVDECLGSTFYSLVLPGKCLIAGFRALFHEGGGMEIGKKDASVDGMEIGKKDASVDGMDNGLDGRTEDASTSFDPRVSSTRMASVDEMDGKFEGGGMEIDKKDTSGDGMDDGMDGRTKDASTSFDPRVLSTRTSSVDEMDGKFEGRTPFDPRVSSPRMSSVDDMDGKFEEGLTSVDVDGRDGKLEDSITSDNALHSLDYSTAPICKDLGLMDRKKRERSAAKSDDAEVPEYLWFEHMFDDESWHWDSTMKRQIEKMSEWFRCHMLRRWKRNILRSCF
jgi:hypothetical protein